MVVLIGGNSVSGDLWGAIECDAPGCECHVSIRPAAGGDVSASEMLDVAADWALEDGWRLEDHAAWCPSHLDWSRERVERLVATLRRSVAGQALVS